MLRFAVQGSAAVLVVAAALAATVAPSSAARRAPCPTAKGKTLASSTSVRLYAVGESDDQRVYSCWLTTARRTLIGTNLEIADNSQELFPLMLAGRYVGFRQASTTDGEDLTVEVGLVDARTGRIRRVDADVTPNAEGDIVGGVDSVLVTPDGATVWAGTASDCAGLHVVRLTGASTVVCGAVSEVAAVGRRVYWQQDGQPRTAVLPAG